MRSTVPAGDAPRYVAGSTWIVVAEFIDDSDDANDYIAFCNGEVGMLLGPGWKAGQIAAECPEMEANIGAFALPGTEPGTTAPVFLGGSNIGVSANSDNPDLAIELVKVITAESFQTQLASLGLLPVRTSLLDLVGGAEVLPMLVAQLQPGLGQQAVQGGFQRIADVEVFALVPQVGGPEPHGKEGGLQVVHDLGNGVARRKFAFARLARAHLGVSPLLPDGA